MRTISSVLWQRLDLPGHDTCRLEQGETGWQLDGAAVFRTTDARHAQLHYRVRCDANWRTQWATVRGWVGQTSVDVSITRDARGQWAIDKQPEPDLGACVDLDLSFTPATNLIAMRRMQLAVGDRSEATAAWLDVEAMELGELAQVYERVGEAQWRYEAPRFDYEGVLQTSVHGFVLDYPGLWRAEAESG